MGTDVVDQIYGGNTSKRMDITLSDLELVSFSCFCTEYNYFVILLLAMMFCSCLYVGEISIYVFIGTIFAYIWKSI